jgi:hypothetical protein
MTNSDAQPARPRRRGQPPQTDQRHPQEQPAIAATAGDAPVLLRIPELDCAAHSSQPTIETAGQRQAVGLEYVTSDVTSMDEQQTAYAEPIHDEPIHDGPSTESLEQPAPNIDSPRREELDDTETATQSPSSTEVRERRRKRRERQAPEKNAWASASGRITIAGEIIVVGVVIAALMIPSDPAENTSSPWDSENLQIGEAEEESNEASKSPFATNAIASTPAASEGSDSGQPWQASDGSASEFKRFIPEPVEGHVAAASGETGIQQAKVQTSYGPLPIPKTDYTPEPKDTYATHRADSTWESLPQDNVHSHGHAHAEPVEVADRRGQSARPFGRPGKFLPSGDTSLGNERYTNEQTARMTTPNENRAFIPAGQQGSQAPPFVQSQEFDPSGNNYRNPYSTNN